MQKFVFSAVFIPNSNDSYTAIIPDLGLVVEGESNEPIEVVYLLIKDYLRVFCEYVVELEEDILLPTEFNKIVENNKSNIVMLVDAIVKSKK